MAVPRSYRQTESPAGSEKNRNGTGQGKEKKVEVVDRGGESPVESTVVLLVLGKEALMKRVLERFTYIETQESEVA